MNMKCLAILGAGGHGKVVADAALASGWNEIHFYDSSWPDRDKNSHWPIVGNDESLLNNLDQYGGVIVAIGDNELRWQQHTLLASKKARLVTIIHPSAQVSPYAVVGVGSVVLANAVINVDARIGDACIMNTGSTIDHDSFLDHAVHICPGANLSGAVSVGFGAWIGVGSSVKQGIKIGQRVLVGAGSVVIADVLDGNTVVGNPAKQIKSTS
jgi:sugar O-acyltransferase (sialic acid O-acetyltransferase NeuD family)